MVFNVFDAYKYFFNGHFRLSDDIYQTAKVAKVLLLLNAGKGAEFKGKSLKDIEVADDEMEVEAEESECQTHKTLNKDQHEEEDSEKTEIEDDGEITKK